MLCARSSFRYLEYGVKKIHNVSSLRNFQSSERRLVVNKEIKITETSAVRLR